RKSNYEQILRILNDTLQGHAEGLGFLMGGTPEFLMDPRRGLYSYEALQTRLAENRFVRDGLVDYSGPVIRLANLSQEDLYILLTKIRHVMTGGDESEHFVPDEVLHAFMDHCHQRIGAAYFKTPRNSIKEFVSLLSVLEQNPEQDWRGLIGEVQVQPDEPEEIEVMPDDSTSDEATPATGDSDSADDDLHRFRL
ncbi:MAG: BREX system ATP-binding domain-containing protein, partial [Wenzhouxiangella sp.]